MAPLPTAAGVVFTILASASCSSVHAFSFAPQHVASTASSWRSSCAPVALRMSDDAASADDATATAAESPAPPVAEPVVDPEVVALKDEISSLESDLKAKKYQLADLKTKADRFTSAGYARQVALGVNNKRTRGASASGSQEAARAVVLRSFLPVLDELDAVGARYADMEFARTFDAGIRSEFQKTLAKLGVAEYVAATGQSLDAGRVVAVEEEYSEECARGTVVRAVKSGLEIAGNVVRPAEVVGSLGSESAIKAAEEGGEAPAEEGDAAE